MEPYHDIVSSVFEHNVDEMERILRTAARVRALLTPIQLECGPVLNVMAALPNIAGALCSTPQSLADVTS